MRDVKYSKQELKNYFNGLFRDDLHRYFCIENDENGGEIISNLSKRGDGYICHLNILKRNPLISSLLYLHFQEPDDNVLPDGTLEEEYMFVGLCSALYLIQFKADESSLKQKINQIKLPWINLNYIYGLEHFLDLSGFLQDINFKKGIEVARDSIYMAIEFLLEDIFPNCNISKNEFFNFVDKELICHYYKYYKTQLTVADKEEIAIDFDTYFTNFYIGDLNKYFKVERSFIGKHVECILSVDYKSVGRWNDGNATGSTRGNMLFSATFIYMYVAQQELCKVVGDEIREEFNIISKWPWILMGPGGGDRLHPFKTLEYSGLLPTKDETSQYVEVVDEVFNAMNKQMMSFIDNSDITPLIEHKQKDLHHALDSATADLKGLLQEWELAPEKQAWEYLHRKGIPIQWG